MPRSRKSKDKIRANRIYQGVLCHSIPNPVSEFNCTINELICTINELNYTINELNCTINDGFKCRFGIFGGLVSTVWNNINYSLALPRGACQEL